MARRDLADHARDLARVERRERDHAVMRAQLPGRAEFGPRRRNDQQRRLRAALGQRLQHVERGRIGPVQVLEGEHDRLGAGAGEHPGGERRELAAAQFLGRQFWRAARRQRRVDHRREQRRIFGGVEPDRAERRLEFGEALFAGDFGAAEAGAAPFRDRDAAACSATAARTPTRPRCAASPRAGRGTPRSAAICRGPARRRSARAAPRRGARAPSGA